MKFLTILLECCDPACRHAFQRVRAAWKGGCSHDWLPHKAALLLLTLAAGLKAQTLTVPWSGYAHDAQHTGLSTIGAQRLERIKWTTPVDLVLQNSPGILYIHYGSPLITAANTVLVAVRTSTQNTYQVEAHKGADGSLLYTLPTDYSPPPYYWIPPYAPALSQGKRLYYAGAGGTIYYRDELDSLSGPSGQIAFYGNSVYAANPSAFNDTVEISTPITADADGNIYFGFDVTGPNPANLVSGMARIDANGQGVWISATAASQGDASIVETALNCAPALSNDGSALYFAVSQGPTGQARSGGYLVKVNSTTLEPIARIPLTDPESGESASISDDASASPTVGPDGDVYYGVLEAPCCENDDRGWLLHFDADLTQVKTPGAFGWDTTASVVPANRVASYSGSSIYLLFTKYNNYAGAGPGGNGHNKIAVLDPNNSMTDPITGVTVMQEVITILGPTLEPPNNSDGSVREWCINSAAIDPFTGSAVANSEDGVVYRWDFATNSLIQQVRLTSGVGEAYTPTSIGADGTAYAINDGNLFAVGQESNLTISSAHVNEFVPGQAGATYTLTATNNGAGPTAGAVTVTDILPSGLTATSIGGAGWTCTEPAGPCTRSDTLATGVSYPDLTLTVDVGTNLPSQVTNVAQVSSDEAANSINATASDVTGIATSGPSLKIVKSHSSVFYQGEIGALYAITVSNDASSAPTSGVVTVTENVPAGLTLTSMSGTGWTCPAGGNTCSRSDELATGASYPPIAVTVNVALNAAALLTNQATVSGGGSSPANASDMTTIAPACDVTGDANATVTDVQKIVDEALGAAPAVNDLNGDGAVTVVDVQIVLNSALGLGCSSL